MQLRKYQEIGVQFLKERKYALIADEPGLGKTAQAIMAIGDVSEAEVLIICPAAVKYQWADQLKMWKHWRGHVINPKSPERLVPGLNVLIVNYDLLIRGEVFKRLKKRRWSHIICDEAHRLKNFKARRTEAVLGRGGLIENADRMWFLTGTPIKNRPVDLHSILSTCVPQLIKPYDSYMRFAFRYCGAYVGAFGLVTTGASRSDELGEKLKPFMLRRLQKDVVTELPPCVVHKVEFESTPEIEKAIRAEEEKTENSDSDIVVHNFGEHARIRKAIALAKIDEAVDFIEERLQEVDKIVVYFHHHAVLHELLSRLKKSNPIFITGNDKPSIRHEKVKVFQSDKSIRLLLGQMQACGEGVDGLQHACHTCIFVEPSGSATETSQCIHRLERMGQKEVVNAYILIVKDTDDAKRMETAEWKEKVYRKTYKASEEESRIEKDDQMHIEERLESVEKNLGAVTNALVKLTEAVTALAGQQVKKTTAAVEPPKATPVPAKTAATKVAPKAQPAVAQDTVMDRTAEEVRALAASITKANPSKKADLREAIQNAGADKIDGLDQLGLNKVYAIYEGIKNGAKGADTDDL